MSVVDSNVLTFLMFVIIALIFTLFIFYFMRTVSKSGKGFVRSKLFLTIDPLLKAFYLFFIGSAFAYILFMAYFMDNSLYGFFIIGELTLGLSLIGLSYMTVLLFLRKKS